MKRISLLMIALLVDVSVFGCTVCTKQQPKIMRGIIHGAGPQSDWDYVIVGGATLIVFVSLFYAIKWVIKPGENEMTHIKHSRFILD